MSPVTVALLDAHPLFLMGEARLFEKSDAFRVVATGMTAEQAKAIATRFRPNLLILDADLDGDLRATISAVHAISKLTKVVAVTASANIDAAVRAFEAGASGYILKASSPEDFMAAAETVLRGGTYINPTFATQVVCALRTAALRKAAGQATQLSVREQQIVRLLLQGRTTNQEIADSLSISVKTVKHYMTLLMQKLRARNRLEVVMAVQKIDGFQNGHAQQPISYN